MISQEQLKKSVSYDPETGIFIWLINAGPARIGNQVKADNGDGYLKIRIGGKSYYLHRLSFLYVNGYLPENNIDHINRIPSDNRWDNLREVSRQCNIRNVGNFKHNTSGVKGVVRLRKNKKWAAFIKINGVQNYIGSTPDFTEAACMRLAAEQGLGWEGCDSSSPAYKHVMDYLSDSPISSFQALPSS